MYTTTKEILLDAKKRRYCTVAADCWSLDSAKTLVDTAIELKMPLIVMLCDVTPKEIADPYQVCELVRRLAADTNIPIAMHLDHGLSIEKVIECIHAGFSSVMIDGSMLPFERNVELTKRVAYIAHSCGVSVEGELGHVGRGGDQTVDVDIYTEPEEAARFVEQTGVDSLAVSIGTSHGIYKHGSPKLDIPRLKRIATLVQAPLVLHGGSGTGLESLQNAAKAGICKLNVMTDLVMAGRAGLAKAPPDGLAELPMRQGIQTCLGGYMKSLSKPWEA